MANRLLKNIQSSIAGGAIILGSASLLSRLIGLARDRLLASTFGAGETLDIYYTAFKLPDFIFAVLVLGALSSAFIPVFIEKRKKSGIAEGWKLTNRLLTLLMLILGVLAGIAILLAPWIVPFIAPGFSPEQQETTTQLTRVMLVSIMFFGVSNMFSGVLNSIKQYASYAFAPIFYNVGIIVGILWFVPQFGIIGLAYGVVLGAALHMIVQIPAVRKAGFKPRLDWNPFHKDVVKIVKLMVPRSISLLGTQINAIVNTAIATGLLAGSVAIFNLADNLQHVPINIFGVSLALAAFPVFSEAFAAGDKKQFREHFSETVRKVLFFVVPASILILLLRAQIVRLVLGAGSFDWEDTVLTAQTLGYFSISLFAQALIPVISRSFFAQQDTKTPVVLSFIGVGINITLALILSQSLGVLGLALAFSIASIIQFFGLMFLLHRKVGDLDEENLAKHTMKILAASLLMVVTVQAAKYAAAPLVDMQTFIGVAIQTVFAGFVGLTTYQLLAMLFRLPEAHLIRGFRTLVAKK